MAVASSVHDEGKRLRAPKVLKVGSDFTGLDAPRVALSRMLGPDKVTHLFSSDQAIECQAVLKGRESHGVVYGDVLARTADQEEYVDLYTWSPPCQSYSFAGKRGGITDSRGKLLSQGIRYISRKKPRCAILENVKGLASGPFKWILKGVVKSLKAMSYAPYCKVLNAKNYGVPQSRERLFVVAIRKDSLCRKFKWPTPLQETLTVTDILEPFNPKVDKICRLPKRKRPSALAASAFKKAFENGVDPRSVPVLVDVDCSPRYATSGINIAKTLTRTRGGQGGPWISTRGRRTSTLELMRLQGFSPGDVNNFDSADKSVKITKTQKGQMLGNSIPVPLMGHVMAEAMWAAGLVASMPDTSNLSRFLD